MLSASTDKIIAPAWCRMCGETRSSEYPFPITSQISGCRSCGSFWTNEELEKMVGAPDVRPFRSMSVEDALQIVTDAIVLKHQVTPEQVMLQSRLAELGIGEHDRYGVLQEVEKRSGYPMLAGFNEDDYCRTVADIVRLLRLRVAGIEQEMARQSKKESKEVGS